MANPQDTRLVEPRAGTRDLSPIRRLTLRRLHDLRSWLHLHTPYVRFLHWRHGPRAGIVGPEKELVIDGYPRSGNTFSVIALQEAAGRRMRIAHHLHTPVQVSLAARWEIPCLVLIRRPEETVASYVLRFPHVTVRQGLRDYVRFYQRIAPLRPHFVLARFEDVIDDFGRVISWINEKFGTDFAPFQRTEANVAAVFRRIETHYRRTHGRGGPVPERIMSRPSPERERLNTEIQNRLDREYRHRGLTELRRTARQLHELLASRPGP